MPQFVFTPAKSVAPNFFENLTRIRNIDEARTARQNALNEFAAREAARRASMQQQSQVSNFIGNIPNAPGNVSGTVALARQLAAQRGWTGPQWDALYQLGMHESGWNPNAQNPSSSAYGIGQFLDSTWSSVGGHKTSDPRLQIMYMLQYIAQRYGSPSVAWGGWHNRYGPGRSGY